MVRSWLSPRGDVHYVVSEYGAVNLFGKSLQERVMAMITIAHPDFREELFAAAKAQGLIGPERTLGEAVKAVYPVRLEENIEIAGEQVTIRPAKPVDDRRIQEHYYSLPKEDVVSRFFGQKTIFARKDVEIRSQGDYVNSLTLVAVVGEFGFGRIVGVAESMRLKTSNMAEVAFSVSPDFQGKGLGQAVSQKTCRCNPGERYCRLDGLYLSDKPGNDQALQNVAVQGGEALGGGRTDAQLPL